METEILENPTAIEQLLLICIVLVFVVGVFLSWGIDSLKKDLAEIKKLLEKMEDEENDDN
jgi:hypothetical protein